MVDDQHFLRHFIVHEYLQLFFRDLYRVTTGIRRQSGEYLVDVHGLLLRGRVSEDKLDDHPQVLFVKSNMVNCRDANRNDTGPVLHSQKIHQ